MSATVPNPLTVSPDTSVTDFVERVLDSNQTTAVVLDDARRLLGIVSIEDALRRMVPYYLDLHDGLVNVMHEGYFDEKFVELAKVTVATIMTKDVVCIAPTETVMKAVVKFVRQGHKTLPVIEDGKFLGTITRRSVLRRVTGRDVSDEQR